METKVFKIFMLLALFTVSLGFSQSQSVSGKVVSSENGEPLPGVNVIVKDTQSGTVTDFDGKFSLSNVPSDGILVFSFVGLKTLEVAVNSQTSFSISMEEDASQLDEGVVVGYGTQKKVNLTGSISTVNLDDAQNRPIANATQALAGQAAGVSVTQTSGRPGADGANIKIRGIGTLGNSNPLVMIDGIRGNLRDVNAADIESITVLKDAASAAIYGSRAANGVILVTTKKGKAGKFTVNYDAYMGIQKATYLTDYVTNSVDFMELLNLAIFNESPTADPAFTADQINQFRTGTDSDLYPNTNWNDVMYRKAQITSHNLSVRGGGEKTTYSFSIGHINQDGILLGTNTKQYTARLNLDTKVSDKFSTSLKISGRHDDINQPVVGAGTITGWVNRSLPMQRPRLTDGSYGFPWVAFPGTGQPLAGALEGKNNTAYDHFVVNLSGEYEFIEGLKLKSTVGTQTKNNLRKVFRPLVELVNPSTGAISNLGVSGNPLSAANYFSTRRDITFVTTLNYKKTLAENHNFDVLAGFNQETIKIHFLSASKDGIPSNALQEISAGAIDPTAGGSSSKFGLQSFFGRLTYDFNGKYLFEANARYDGTSNFADGNRWGLFPSFSAGWNISKESFMEDVNFIDNLKLRASWGQLGNQEIGPNLFASFYNLGQAYSFGGTLVSGAAQTNLSNPDVTWETSTQTDIGVDLTALDGKLGVVADYYIKNTDNILRGVAIPTAVGALGAPVVNLASVQNKGFEFLVNYNDNAGDFEYGASFNLTTINNKVTKIPAPQIGNTRLIEGSSINEWFAIKMLGIFQEGDDIANSAQPNAQPGDIRFEDFNNDGKIDNEDRQAAGQSIPDLIYGFDLSLAYKGFDFSMLWQGVEGIYANTEEEQKPFFNSAGIPKFWAENRWTPENPSTKYPRLTRSSNYVNNQWRFSTFLIEDASFLRLKNIQLGYSLPSKVLEKIKLDKLRVYVNATNPLTFTKYRGLDPEKDPYVGRGSYSNVRVYSLGLNISL